MSMTLSKHAGWAVAGAVALLIIGCAESGRNREESTTASSGVEGAAAGVAASASAESGATAGNTGSMNAGDTPDGTAATASNSPDAATGGTIAPGTALARAEPTIVFLGTSLTAGYGLAPEQAFPAVVEALAEEAGNPVRVVNAGLSGETSAGALRRVDWLLRQPFDVLVIETGANDMLRGTDAAATEMNIQAIVDRVGGRYPDARIILAGMLAMPNLGSDYAARFEPVYRRLAERNDLTLIPFLLDGVAGDPALNQADGIHPNARGQRIVAETVWRTLAPIVREGPED